MLGCDISNFGVASVTQVQQQHNMMFELPDAKSILRSDLYTRSESASPTPSEPDPELEARYRAHLASIYGPPTVAQPILLSIQDDEPLKSPNDSKHPADEEPEPEQEFEFRLFSTNSYGPSKSETKDAPAAQTIILRNEAEEDGGEGGFVVRERHRGYYFAESAVGDKKRGFEIMAVSGEEIFNLAQKRAWGLEVPWRVRVIRVTGKRKDGYKHAVEGVEAAETGKRKRLGKKRRIILRETRKAREKAKEQEQKKAEAEREKRTRRNREKKVKRKMREKVKKAGGRSVVVESAEPSFVGADDQSFGE